MENTIARRIYDFLKGYPPFNMMEPEGLMRLARGATVQYGKPGMVLFRRDDLPEPYVYVVREGAVQLFLQQADDRVLVDECDEGDLFGLRPLLAGQHYALSAEVKEESLMYVLKASELQRIMQENPKVAFYLAGLFAAGGKKDAGDTYRSRLFLSRERLIDAHFQLIEIQSTERSKEPVTCPAGTSIRDAAKKMSRHSVGSIIIVDAANHPLGIMTDKDLRKQVATGQQALTAPVDTIMSSPVITVAPSVTVADVQIEMVKHRVHHLCLTEDGGPNSPVIGVLSEHDILVLQGNNPAVLIREMRRKQDAAGLRHLRERAELLLRKYIYQEVSIAFISTVMTEINDALIQRAVELGLEAMEQRGYRRPETQFCWLALGSEGRSEQLLRTDQDSALVFENVQEEDYAEVQQYFLTLADWVTNLLNDCGFEYCPAGMMANNPKWCLSLDRWKEQFSRWITEPTPGAVMHSTIFFDFRPIFGRAELAGQLTTHIFSILDRQTVFMSTLAKNALQNPPPLTFFRNFVVEKSGEHEDEFDIKARGMMPLADAARVLILHARISGLNNTFRRFEKLAELEPKNRELLEQAADAYEILMRYRTLQGLRQGDSGRFFRPSELSKMERMNLRNSFRPIRELQSLLSTRFQTAFIR